MLVDNKFQTGAVEDSKDERDYSYEDFVCSVGALEIDWEKGYDIRNKLGADIDIKNQNSSSSCVGQGWSYQIWVFQVLEMMKKYNMDLKELREKHPEEVEEISSKAIYSQIFLPNGGAMIRSGGLLTVNWGAVFDSIVPSKNKDGIATEEFMRDKEWITDEINKIAETLKGKEARVISARNNMDLFAQAIIQNKGVVGGVKGCNGKGWGNSQRPKPPANANDIQWGHCFTAGNNVLTTEGYKKIEDVKIGDLVLTHKNRFKKVINTSNKKYDGIVYKTETQSSVECVTSTPEHKFLTVKLKQPDRISHCLLSEDINEKMEYKEIKDILLDKTIYGKNNKREVFNNLLVEGKITEEKEQQVTQNKAFLLGAYLGDGNLKEKGRKENDFYCLRFSLGTNDKKLFLKEKIITFMEKEFSVSAKVYPVKNEKCELVVFYRKDIVPFFAKYCGTPKNKHIDQSILFLPNDILLSFIDGWYLTDGTYDETNNKKIISTSEKNLAFALSGILNKLNISFSVQRRASKTSYIQGRKVNAKESWHFSFFDIKDDKHKGSWFANNTKLLRPKKITKDTYNGLVYDLEVEEDHSFTINNIVVHNCLFYGAFGTDEYGKFIATPNSWGKKSWSKNWKPGDKPGTGWQKLYADYFDNRFQFNPWTYTDLLNKKTMTNAKIIHNTAGDGKEHGIYLPIYSEDALISMAGNFGLDIPKKENGSVDWDKIKINGETNIE